MIKVSQLISMGSVELSQFSIPLKESTKWQNHHDHECLIILQGYGEVMLSPQVGEVSVKSVKAGDILVIEPFISHEITNVSSTEEMEIINVWWEEKQIFLPPQNERQNPCLVLPSFTTPNGYMHLGHIVGPVLGADIFYRTQKILHKQAYQICGSIGYQTHVNYAAEKLNKTFRETALFYSQNFSDNYRVMNIYPEVFLTLEEHQLFEEIAQSWLKDLYQKDILVEKTEAIPFCEQAHGYLFEANVKGICPHCAHPMSSECEFCAVYVPDSAILSPVCVKCEISVNKRPMKRLYIPLENYRGVLINALMSGAYIGKTADFVERILSFRELPDVPISILAEHGIPIHLNPYTNHKMYSAVELIPRFLTAFSILETNYNLLSPSNLSYLTPCVKGGINIESPEKYDIALFFGSDNSYLRCIIFPILLSISHAKYFSVTAYHSNEFFLLDNEKFSTSRNHVLFAKDILDRNDADWLRLYLFHVRPISEKKNFNLQEYTLWAKHEQKEIFSMLLNVQEYSEKYFNGLTQEAGTWERKDFIFMAMLKRIQTETQYMLRAKNFNFRVTGVIIKELQYKLETYIKESLVKRENQSLMRTSLAISLIGLRLFFTILWPITPILSKNILKCLCITTDPILDQALEWIPSKNHLQFTHLNIIEEITI